MLFLGLERRVVGALAATVSMVASIVALAGPVTANFDAFDTSGGDTPISSPYLGFTWTNVTAYTTTSGFTGFNNGIVSPANAAYGGGQVLSNLGVAPLVSSISAGTLFDFVSAFLGAGYYDGLTLNAQGLRGGVLLYSQMVMLGTGGAQNVDFGFDDIDTLNLFGTVTGMTTDPFACGGFNCTQFTLDNVQLIASDVIAPPVNPIPEPNSLALALVAGIGALGASRAVRRRRPGG